MNRNDIVFLLKYYKMKNSLLELGPKIWKPYFRVLKLNK